MKLLNLILWVGQFGFSAIFPTLLFLMLGAWLHVKFSWGLWVIWVLGILGVLTSIQTTKACWKSLKKAADELSPPKDQSVSFNDHT